MLTLDRQPVEIVHFATRIEKHGDERVLAHTTRIRITDSNQLLDMIDPGLRKALFRRADVIEKQQVLDAVPGSDQTPIPTTDVIKTVPLNFKLKDVDVTVHHGISGDGDVLLRTCKIDTFEVEVLKGGTAPIEATLKGPIDISDTEAMNAFWLDESALVSTRAAAGTQMELDENSAGDGEEDPEDDPADPLDTAGEIDDEQSGTPRTRDRAFPGAVDGRTAEGLH